MKEKKNLKGKTKDSFISAEGRKKRRLMRDYSYTNWIARVAMYATIATIYGGITVFYLQKCML